MKGHGKNLVPAKLPARLAARSAVATATRSTATTAAKTATTAGSAATTSLARAGLIDVDLTAPDIGRVERRNGTLRFPVIGHFHKTEATGTTGVTIRNQANALHRTVSFEQAANTRFRCAEIQIAYENILHLSFS